jgi:hypothetical protein
MSKSYTEEISSNPVGYCHDSFKVLLTYIELIFWDTCKFHAQCIAPRFPKVGHKSFDSHHTNGIMALAMVLVAAISIFQKLHKLDVVIYCQPFLCFKQNLIQLVSLSSRAHRAAN